MPRAGSKPIYVETAIRGSLDELWARTQEPENHERWDLRFTEIDYLPRPDLTQPQQFRYATRIGFGLRIEGYGETAGEHDGVGGQRTSALRFWSTDPKSLIREGSGYWQYIPTDDGVRFVTAYDYAVRFGWLGALVDRVAFRPLIGWATAWSFDRLRLWIEDGTDPGTSLRQSIIAALARTALGAVWIYHGAIPKLLHPHPDEQAMLRDGGVPARAIRPLLTAIGTGEIVFGALLLGSTPARWPLLVSAALMIPATIGVAAKSPRFLGAAFNPITLNLLMATLAAIGLLTTDAPSARRCLPRRHGQRQ
jgi:uncharacterized membrane protein YphA (DoxX/SURF4 family)